MSWRYDMRSPSAPDYGLSMELIVRRFSLKERLLGALWLLTAGWNRNAELGSLKDEFGYIPDERNGERWWIDDEGRYMFVGHPSREIRIYRRGCGGRYTTVMAIPESWN